MRKMNYPKVQFLAYINDEKEWGIVPWVKMSDICKFNKKVYKLAIKDNISSILTDDNEIIVQFDDFVEIVRKLHKGNNKFLEYIRFINDYKKSTNQLADACILDICKIIKSRGNEVRKNINLVKKHLINNNDKRLKEINDYVEYLADRCIIQDESLIDMYSMAYEYIIKNKLNWLKPTLNYMDYDY